jgi:hypothetical protein
MTHLSTRLVATAAFFGIGWSVAACSAIIAPKDDVQRCSTADDCDGTGDPRYVAECRFDEANLDLDTTEVDKICVASFKVQSCDPDTFGGVGGDHPFRVAFDERSPPSNYSCPSDADAPRGCAPAGGFQCADGMVTNQLGFCDVEENPANPAYSPDGDTLPYGQDVLDAFCQSFFCEGDWVCDEDRQCVKCDPDPEVPIGEGGCGTVFIGGQPSCVYPGGQLSCGDGNTDADNPRFGDCG